MQAIYYFITGILFLTSSCSQEKPEAIAQPSEVELFKAVIRGVKNPNGAKIQVSPNQLEGESFVPGEIVHLAQKGHIGNLSYLFSLRANKKGKIEALLETPEFAEYYLVSEDHATILNFKVDPNRLSGRTPSGGSFSLERTSADGELYLFSCTGLKPGETLTIRSTSSAEEVEAEFPIDETGSLEMGLAPGVLTGEGGIAQLEIRRENQEQITIEYPWGTALGKAKPSLKIH